VDLEVARVWVVAGRLVTPGGAPVARARIDVENAGFGEPIADDGGPGGDGSFRRRLSPPLARPKSLPVRLPRIEAGPLALRVVAEGRVDVVVPLDVERLRVEAFQDVGEIVLPDGAELIVFVREPEGAPVAGAAVSAQRRGDGGGLSRSGSTDDAGRCRLDGLEIGDYVLIARSERHVAAVVPRVAVAAPRGAEALVVMERGVAIEGVVIDEAGDPVEGATVRVEVSFGGGDGASLAESRAARTAADGSFRVEGLPPDFRERHERLAASLADAGRRPPPPPFVVSVTTSDERRPRTAESAGVAPGEPVTIILR
jgi:hypothetical protein